VQMRSDQLHPHSSAPGEALREGGASPITPATWHGGGSNLFLGPVSLYKAPNIRYR
jgi:hypothetical protein